MNSDTAWLTQEESQAGREASLVDVILLCMLITKYAIDIHITKYEGHVHKWASSESNVAPNPPIRIL